MIDGSPRWVWERDRRLVTGYEHVRLVDGCVLGQWFCLDATTGATRWEGGEATRGLDTVAGLSQGVIVATRTHSSGPGTFTSGCVGISLGTGERVWEATAPPPTGMLARLFRRFVEVSEAVDFVDGEAVYCRSGQILDARSGEVRGRAVGDEVHELERAYHAQRNDRPDQRFYARLPVDFAGGVLRRGTPRDREPEGVLRRGGRLACYLEGRDGSVQWQFELPDGLELDGNFYSHRWVPPTLYIVASEGPQRSVEGREGSEIHVPRAVPYRLLLLDGRRGEVRASVPLGDSPVFDARIEDLDGETLLVSARTPSERYRLWCFDRRRPGGRAG